MGQTVRQVRHFYVTDSFSIADGFTPDKHLDTAGSLGEMKAFVNDSKNHLYFEYRGHGGVTRTDIIPLSNIEYLNIASKEDLRLRLKGKKMVLKLPSPVKDMVLTFKLGVTNLLSLSSSDIQYAMVPIVLKAGGTYTESDILKELALSLAKGINRALFNTVEVLLSDDDTLTAVGTTLTLVTSTTSASSLSGTYKGLVLREAKPLGWSPYNRLARIDFDFSVSIDEFIDGVVTIVNAPFDYTKPENYVGNGIQVKDDEYFYLMGRGNVYGLNPNYVASSEGVADINKEYDVLNIHYSYIDNGVSFYKSDKDITIAGKKAELEKLVTALKGAKDTNYVAPTAPKKGATLEEC